MISELTSVLNKNKKVDIKFSAYDAFRTITLENTAGATKKGQSREIDNIGYPRHRTKTSKTITHHYAQANTNNVNKT